MKIKPSIMTTTRLHVVKGLMFLILVSACALFTHAQLGSGGEGITSLNLTNGALGYTVNNNINVIRAYVKAGESVTFHVHKGDMNGGMANDPGASGAAWHITIYNANGTPTESATYSPSVAASNDFQFGNANSNTYQDVTYTAASSGIWTFYIRTDVPTNAMSLSYNIKVTAGSTIQPGRAFTEVVNLNQLGGGATYATFNLYYVSKFGAHYKTTYTGFQGIGSSLYADAYGVRNTSTNASTYKSRYTGDPSTYSANLTDASGIAGGYKTFFNIPDFANLPTTDQPYWDVSSNVQKTTWLNNSPSTTTVSINNVSAVLNLGSTNGIKYTFTVTGYSGNGTMLIDPTGTNNFAATNTALIAKPIALTEGNNTYIWNGTDANGNALTLTAGQSISAQIQLSKASEIHFALNDVEVLTGGLRVARLNANGTSEMDYTLYWDDNYWGTAAQPSHCSSTSVVTNTTGTNSINGVHGWYSCEGGTGDPNTSTTNVGSGTDAGSWGNNRIIDNWAYESGSNVTSNTNTLIIPNTYSISGHVYNDADGLVNNTVDGTGINPGSLRAILIGAGDGYVYGSQAIASDGTYSFSGIFAGDANGYKVILTTSNIPTGQNVGTGYSASLTSGWASTGEFIGTGAGHDATTDGILSIPLTTSAPANITNANFGIHKKPTADNKTYTFAGGMYQPAVNSIYSMTNDASTAANVLGQLTGATNYTGGVYNTTSINLNGNTPSTSRKLVITSVPNHGTLLYNGTAITTNGTTISNYDKTLLNFQFTGSGYTTTTFKYAYIDDANITSDAATYTIVTAYALPVKLVSFSGIITNQIIQLKWSTSSEINSNFFEVQRSLDGGITWSTIGNVKAAGNSNNTKNYSFVDQTPGARNIYRLNMVDLDEGQEYSPLTNVFTINENSSDIHISPNPVVKGIQLRLIFDTPVQNVTGRIVDISGKTVQTFTIPNEATSLNVATDRLTSGMYIIQITSKNGTYKNLKFIVK